MIWDEARQDKDLFEFFKNLIALRKTYYNIIGEAFPKLQFWESNLKFRSEHNSI
jgi:pullulanase/glycogen debranching enzyme